MKYRLHLNQNRQMAFLHILSAPIIYMQIIPLVIFDLFIEIYQHLCFPIYRIPLVRRSDYIRIDRHKLSYLNWYEKINCAYCGYANGWFHYATTIAAETEKYWCGITHAKYNGFKPPEHHKDFLPYGDEKSFDEFVKK